MNPSISLVKVSKVYSSDGVPVSAISDVSLSIGKGEFSVLAGPSGSGKSTLLHMIGALDRPTSGTVTVAGEDLSALSRSQLAAFRLHKIGFVFQSYNLIPVLSALENVEYPLLLQKVGRRERQERALSLLRQVGLEDQRNKRPDEMSGGQQQRVAVARALSGQPELILADEPTANLDSETGRSLIDLFRDLNERSGVTFVFASHDPMVVERARRVLRLKDGQIV